MKYFKEISLIFICLLIIIQSVFISQLRLSRKNREDFFEDDMPIISDRIYYFKIGLSSLFTDQSKLTKMADTDFLSWIKKYVYVWPNYQDFCCKSMTNKDDKIDCGCENINLSMSACPDESMHFFNEARINTIEGNVGAPRNTNCMMTILGNNYMFMKRSINITLTRPIDQVGTGDNKLYRLTLIGNLSSIILSRPLFISFNTNGLYRVIYEDYTKATGVDEFEPKKERNGFAYYDSTKNPQHIYLSKVKDDEIENKVIFTESVSNIFKNVSPFQDLHPATIYYLTHKSDVKVSDTDTHTMNLCINKMMYSSEFSTSNTIELITENDDAKFMNGISLKKEEDGILSLIIDNENIYEIPSEFSYNNPNTYSKFDIFFSFAMDVITIVCLGTESKTRRNVAYVARYHTKKTFTMKKSTLKNALEARAPNMYNYMETYLKDTMNSTAMPNFAKLGYKLGYNFNIY